MDFPATIDGLRQPLREHVVGARFQLGLAPTDDLDEIDWLLQRAAAQRGLRMVLEKEKAEKNSAA